jgi:23S rRNA (uracil1939-C5)-methyltransferase
MPYSSDTVRDTVRFRIEKLVPGGEGLARQQDQGGRVVFVPGVLPGEEVVVEILEAKKDFARARLLEVVEASPDRVTPPCRLAGRCGGCDWLHIDPAAQARLKVELARDALRRMAGFDLPDLRIETGAPLGYRNRVQVHVDRSGRVGFQGRRAHDIVAAKECPVAHAALAPLFAEGARPGAPERFLAYGFTEETTGAPRLFRSDENPDAEIVVRVVDRDIVFPLRGFFQSNLEMTQRLIPYMLEGLPPGGGTVLDLYSGVGLFGAFLKDRFDHVVCVEFNRHAIKVARRNVGEKGAFVAEALENVVVGKDNPFDRIPTRAAVIDPPREGLDKAVRKWLVDKPVPHLVYVSCNPVTLARDLKELLAGPYELEDMRLFDFYPQTSHIEAAARLRMKAA